LPLEKRPPVKTGDFSSDFWLHRFQFNPPAFSVAFCVPYFHCLSGFFSPFFMPCLLLVRLFFFYHFPIIVFFFPLAPPFLSSSLVVRLTVYLASPAYLLLSTVISLCKSFSPICQPTTPTYSAMDNVFGLVLIFFFFFYRLIQPFLRLRGCLQGFIRLAKGTDPLVPLFPSRSANRLPSFNPHTQSPVLLPSVGVCPFPRFVSSQRALFFLPKGTIFSLFLNPHILIRCVVLKSFPLPLTNFFQIFYGLVCFLELIFFFCLFQLSCPNRFVSMHLFFTFRVSLLLCFRLSVGAN